MTVNNSSYFNGNYEKITIKKIYKEFFLTNMNKFWNIMLNLISIGEFCQNIFVRISNCKKNAGLHLKNQQSL